MSAKDFYVGEQLLRAGETAILKHRHTTFALPHPIRNTSGPWVVARAAALVGFPHPMKGNANLRDMG